MHMPVVKAAEALAVSPDFLHKKLVGKTLMLKEGISYCQFLDAADAVGLDKAVAEKVMAGKEWLLTGVEIRDTYDITLSALHKMSVYRKFEGDRGPVFAVSKIIEHHRKKLQRLKEG